MTPVEPKPEDFGLTAARLSWLEHPILDTLSRLPALARWLLYPVLMGLVTYLVTGSLAKAIGWILFGWLLLVPAFLVLGALWRRVQPDYRAFAQFQAAKAQYKRDLAEWMRTQQQWWRSLSGSAFEVEVARVFQRRGYAVQRTGGAGDEGVDLRLAKDGKSILAQCKAHKNPVGPAVVRDLYGTLLHHKHAEAWLISTSGFTVGARRFAQGKPLRLVTLEDLLREITGPN